MNYLDRFAEELKKEKRKIFLYGAGYIADKISVFLGERGIKIDGYVVDEKYLPVEKDRRIKCGLPIVSPNDLDKDCVLIDAIQLKDNPVELPQNKYIRKTYRLDFSSCFLHGVYDESFVLKNMPKLMDVYNRLCDSDSRIAMVNFISQKMTGWHCKPASPHTQYFDEDVFLPQENEVFVDCGAYDGDSLLDFFDFIQRNHISSYKKCFAFEPDIDNFKKLKENVADYPNVALYQIGTYNCRDTLHFSDGNDTGSSIQNSGETIIEVDAIDNIVKDEKVTYIKMDIEGAELDSLKGAQKTILRCRPKLAICVYHRIDDLLTIPDFILSLHSDYKLYLRNYKKAGVDTVLYAV